MDSGESLLNIEDNHSVSFSNNRGMDNDDDVYDYNRQGYNDQYMVDIKQERLQTNALNQEFESKNKLLRSFNALPEILDHHMVNDDQFQRLLGIKEENYSGIESEQGENDIEREYNEHENSQFSYSKEKLSHISTINTLFIKFCVDSTVLILKSI